MGYGGWSLFFAPEVVSGLASIASDWPAELNAMERYEQALDVLYQQASEPSLLSILATQPFRLSYGGPRWLVLAASRKKCIFRSTTRSQSSRRHSCAMFKSRAVSSSSSRRKASRNSKPTWGSCRSSGDSRGGGCE